jgi:hypothetical protein
MRRRLSLIDRIRLVAIAPLIALFVTWAASRESVNAWQDAPPESQPSGAAAGSKPAQPPTLRRILESWKARQSADKTLHLTWETKLPGLGNVQNDRPREEGLRVIHNELWLDGDDHIRYDESVAGDGGYRMIRDGDISNCLTWRGDSAEAAHGEIWSGKFAPVGLNEQSHVNPALAGLARNPPWMTFRPHAIFDHLDAFRLIAEDAIIDGADCAKIEWPVPSRNVVETLYVDPARADLIVLRESKVADPNARCRLQGVACSISILYRQDSRARWIPSRWTTRVGDGQAPLPVAVSTVTSCTINEKLPDGTFKVGFLEGTAVIDRRSLERYRIGKNGTKTDLLQVGSVESLKLYDVLDTFTDFAIEPQSLKDALAFISARYQIKILVDERALQAAGIDATSEVQCKNGLTVRELFKSLSDQMSRPLAFKVREGTLVVGPASKAAQ